MQFRNWRAARSAAAVLVVCAVAEAGAQQARLAITGGTATDQMGSRSNALTVAPTLSILSTEGLAMSLSGHATRFGTSAWSLGGAASLGAHERLVGPVALTLDGSMSVARLTAASRATFMSGDVLPGARVDVGRVSLFAAARFASGMTAVTPERRGLPLAPGSEPVRTTRSGAGSAIGASVLAISQPGVTLSFAGRSDRLRLRDDAISDVTLSAHMRSRVLGVDASIGRRAGAERGSFGGVGISLPVGDDVALELAGGRYLSNPLLGTPGGEYLSAGLSIRIGDAPSPSRERPTRIPGVPQPPRGHTRLAIAAPNAGRVEVAGDFTEWAPIRTTRAANGMWYADLRIPPGQYRYAFRIDGSEWRVPRGATAVDDGFGGTSAWLIVTVDEPGV